MVYYRNIDLIRLRFDEIFNHAGFEDEIAGMTDIEYVKVSQDVSDKIYAFFEEGTLECIHCPGAAEAVCQSRVQKRDTVCLCDYIWGMAVYAMLG